MDSQIRFEIPNARELASLDIEAYTELLQRIGTSEWNPVDGVARTLNRTAYGHGRGGAGGAEMPADYSMVVVTIWLIVIGAFFAVTMVFCVFSCVFYNKVRQWNLNAQIDQHEAYAASVHQCNDHTEDDALPSYALVSGLPTYEDVMNQLPPSYAADIRRYPHQHYIQIGYFAPSSSDQKEAIASAFPAMQSVTIVTAANNNHGPITGEHQLVDNNTPVNHSTHERTSGGDRSCVRLPASIAYEDELDCSSAGNASRSADLATTKQPLLTRKSSRPEVDGRRPLKGCRPTSKSHTKLAASTMAITPATPTTASSISSTKPGPPDVGTMS